MPAKQVRAQYAQEYKLEAVRQVKAGQSMAMVASRIEEMLPHRWQPVASNS